MPTATARKPAPTYQSYEARQTLARRAERAAVVAAERKKFDAERARVAAQTKAAVAVEKKKFEAFCAKHPMKLHKMADVSGKWWQCTDPVVLRKHIAERNRLLNSPGYKDVMAGLEEGRRRAASPPRGWRPDGGQFEHKAVRGPGARAFGHADDELVEDWTDEFRDDDFDDDDFID